MDEIVSLLPGNSWRSGAHGLRQPVVCQWSPLGFALECTLGRSIGALCQVEDGA